MPLRQRCPECGVPVTRLQRAAPTRAPGVVIAYPCQHWLAADRFTTVSDRDLLARARKAADEARPEDDVVYDQAALAELRRD